MYTISHSWPIRSRKLGPLAMIFVQFKCRRDYSHYQESCMNECQVRPNLAQARDIQPICLYHCWVNWLHYQV